MICYSVDKQLSFSDIFDSLDQKVDYIVFNYIIQQKDVVIQHKDTIISELLDTISLQTDKIQLLEQLNNTKESYKTMKDVNSQQLQSKAVTVIIDENLLNCELKDNDEILTESLESIKNVDSNNSKKNVDHKKKKSKFSDLKLSCPIVNNNNNNNNNNNISTNSRDSTAVTSKSNDDWQVMYPRKCKLYCKEIKILK